MSLLLTGIVSLPLSLRSSPQPLLPKCLIPILPALLRSLPSFQNALIVLRLHRSHPRRLFEGLSLQGDMCTLMGWMEQAPLPCGPASHSMGRTPTMTCVGHLLSAMFCAKLSTCFTTLSLPVISSPRGGLVVAQFTQEETEVQRRKESCPSSPCSLALKLRFEPMSVALRVSGTCTL